MKGIEKTRNSLWSRLSGLFSLGPSEELYDSLEENLILADCGVDTSVSMIEELRLIVKRDKLRSREEIGAALASIAVEKLQYEQPGFDEPCLFLVVGVNGVGKTTTIGKLAHFFCIKDRRVMLVAGDTFRAAASEQLGQWAQRTGAQFVRGSEGGDPAAVVFDGINAAKARNCGTILCDTAGRLHNKKNLMEELRKIRSVAERSFSGCIFTLLVMDATTGLNGLEQVRLFNDVVPIDGIVLTKLDGTAKGGVVLAIAKKTHTPVWFCGVGEQVDDLKPFNPQEYAESLFT